MAVRFNFTGIPALLGAAVVEAFVVKIAIPQHLPPNPLVWTLTRTLALNIGLFILYHCYIYPFLLSPLRKLPVPKGAIPFLNHGYVIFKKPPGGDFLKWTRETDNNGMILWRGFGNQERLLLTGPESLSEVLVQKSYDFVKPAPIRNFLRVILGNGLIITEGDEHKFQRKHIMPVFSFRHIKELYPMMYRKAIELADGVTDVLKENPMYSGSEKGTAGEVEINHWANKVTMDIIGVAGLGKEFLTLKKAEDEQHELIQNYEEILEPTVEKNLYFTARIVLPTWLVFKLPWGLNERIDVITTNLKRICGELVRDKREEIKKGGDNFDILSVLIKSDNFNDKELVDQMLTFLAAGHETTSSAFTWATYLLSTHKEIQHQLRQEIKENVSLDATHDANLAQTLESLPLLNAVCNETIRLYPTVPVTIRVAARDTTIQDIKIPKNTQILLCPWATNRSPKLWGPDADDFKPSRWINADGKPNNTGGASSNYSQLTFLHGPRSCIGKDFAKAELRCLVAAFVKKFELDLAMPLNKVVPGGVITSKPAHGMMLKLTVVEE